MFLLEAADGLHLVDPDVVELVPEVSVDGSRRVSRVVWNPSPATLMCGAEGAAEALARAATFTAAELCAARAAAESDPTERASHWFELGRLHAERRSDIRAAKAAWTRSLDTEPTYAPALDSLADLAYRERDLAAADALYARLPVNTSRLPPDVVMLRRAELAEALGDDARALQLAQSAARLGPSRRDIYATCARLQAMGYAIGRPPRDGHMAFVRSPDLVSIELLQDGYLAPREPWASMPNTGVW